MHEGWSKEKPKHPGAYWVRGFRMMGSEDMALVEVTWYSEDDGENELVCNLHVSNSEDDTSEWSPLDVLSNEFEWKGPLVYQHHEKGE